MRSTQPTGSRRSPAGSLRTRPSGCVMDDVARLPFADRTDLFVATANRHALTAAIIEKDFWVCWTLKRIFTLTDPPAGFTPSATPTWHNVHGP